MWTHCFIKFFTTFVAYLDAMSVDDIDLLRNEIAIFEDYIEVRRLHSSTTGIYILNFFSYYIIQHN